MAIQRSYETKPPQTRTLVLHPEHPPVDRHAPESLRSPEEKLAEAVRLAEAIDVNVVIAEIAPLRELTPATFIGTGKADDLAERIASLEIELLVFNATLSPGQQRNLEKALSCKVIDRTALILEIFGARARTREGTLQVELASLEYQKSRLVRSWTHLERQRGGAGFMGGPGETQIETDRRIIRDRIALLKKQIEKVKRTRNLHREKRAKVPYPIVALVGYTNAGKSTLFNTLTGAEVMAEDMLFATLDPTMRQIRLPAGVTIMLSDTVGFISDLPTQLVAAFRATLEEVMEADVILHVRDIASNASEAEKQDVEQVLSELGVLREGKENIPIIEVWNKVDLLLDAPDPSHPKYVAVSALKNTGISGLLERIDTILKTHRTPFTVTLPISNGKLLAWIHAHGSHVTTETNDDHPDFISVTAHLSDKHRAQLEHLLALS